MSCKFVATNQPRILPGRHGADCPEGDCPGCAPCTLDHCIRCGRTHVDQLVCPGCIADAREDLAEIPNLAARMPREAQERGIESEATHLAGPIADLPQWRQRGIYGGHRGKAPDMLGEDHPLWVLGTWEFMWCEHFGHMRTLKITVARAADYLGRNLADAAQESDLDFPVFAREIAACRHHMEVVLRDGEQVERVAPCVSCGTPLIRTTTEHGVRYECHTCRNTLTAGQYDYAVRVAHLAHADRLAVPDLAIRIEVPESTIRRWANPLRVQREGEKPVEHPPLIRDRGRDGRNRKVYLVDDALEVKRAGDHRRSATVSNDGAA